jgi:hypothetical protein
MPSTSDAVPLIGRTDKKVCLLEKNKKTKLKYQTNTGSVIMILGGYYLFILL